MLYNICCFAIHHNINTYNQLIQSSSRCCHCVDCKINGRALVAAQAQLRQFGLAGTNTGCFRVGCSCCWQLYRVLQSLLQLLLIAAGLLEENVLLLLQYLLGSRIEKVLMLCKFWTVRRFL